MKKKKSNHFYNETQMSSKHGIEDGMAITTHPTLLWVVTLF